MAATETKGFNNRERNRESRTMVLSHVAVLDVDPIVPLFIVSSSSD